MTGPGSLLRTAGLAAAALLLGACSSSSTTSSPQQDSAGAAPTPTAPGSASAGASETPPAVAQYVALGDSYTAAPAVGRIVGPRVCFRTDANYPHLLAARLDLDLVDVSCSGATSDDLTASQAPGVPAQLDALTPATELVTLGMGGNDGGLFSSLVGLCARTGFGGGTATGSCADAPRFAEPALTAELDRLSDRIAATVATVRERSPKARVVVVGYPQLVPPDGGCDLLPLRAGDEAFARGLNQRLDRAIRTGARRADALFADVWAATAGHDACSADPWLAGIRPARPAIPLHPYAEYEKAAADTVAALL